MYRSLGPDYLSMSASSVVTKWFVPSLGECLRHIVNPSNTKYLAVIQVQRAELGTAKPRRIGQYDLEDRIDLAGRA